MVLEKLIGLEKKNAATLDSIQKSVNALVKGQAKEAAQEAGRERRAASLARREKSDRQKSERGILAGMFGNKAGKGSKDGKGGGGFLGGILGSMKGALIGALAAPLVIKAVGGILITGFVAALNNKKFRDALGEALKYALDFARKTGQKIGSHIINSTGNRVTGGGMTDVQRRGRSAKIETDDKKEKKRIQELIDLSKDKFNLEKELYEIESRRLQAKEDGDKITLEREEKAKANKEEEIQGLINELKLREDIAKAHNIPIESEYKVRGTKDLDWGNMGTNINVPLMEKYGYEFQKKQTGGPLRVPGSGSGDTVPAILPPGSFVMNRNAAGFQTGGVPVMLEPGEDVYSPGSWGPMEMMMNKMVPRFQQGGAVKDAKDPSSTDSKGTKPDNKEGKQIDLNSVQPGGRLEFIGVGDGITGELRVIDGSGKKVASYMATSGTFATAGATQDQRRNQPGTNNPLPDGNYPLLPVVMHKGQKVGDWSAYINNQGGVIGRRGEILLHNDTQDNGTAGCIGVNNLGGRGSKKSMAMAELLQRVNPTSVNVNLASSEGKPGQGVAGAKSTDNFQPGKDAAAETRKLSGLESVVGEGLMGLGDKLGLPGLTWYMGELYKQATSELGALAQVLFPGLSAPASAAEQSSGEGNKAGMAGGAKMGAMDVVGGMGFGKKGWDIYRNTLAEIESGGKYNIAGGSRNHYDGRYQMGAAAKTDAARILGVQDPGHSPGAREKFRQNAEMQEKFFAAFTQANYNYLMKHPKFASAKKSRQLEILGYAHNQGMGGAEKWLNTGIVGSDGFGTKGTRYSEALKANFKSAGMQTGGTVNMKGSSTMQMRRFAQAQEMFDSMKAASAAPIIINAGGGGGGGGGTQVALTSDGAPSVPNLAQGPQVVALLELQNRLALGASI